MRVLLGLDGGTLEFLNSLRSRFSPDCETKCDQTFFILLDHLPIAHAHRYPKILRKIVDRHVPFHLGSVIPFQQFEGYKNGRYKPPGATLKTYPTAQLSKICSELLEALNGLPGIEKIRVRDVMYTVFSRPQLRRLEKRQNR
jgi:hypothetical protein